MAGVGPKDSMSMCTTGSRMWMERQVKQRSLHDLKLELKYHRKGIG